MLSILLQTKWQIKLKWNTLLVNIMRHTSFLRYLLTPDAFSCQVIKALRRYNPVWTLEENLTCWWSPPGSNRSPSTCKTWWATRSQTPCCVSAEYNTLILITVIRIDSHSGGLGLVMLDTEVRVSTRNVNYIPLIVKVL